MPATWPATMPFIEAEDDANYSSPDYHHRSEMDAGQPKVRLRSADIPAQRSGTVPRVNYSQMLEFREFYRDDLNFGTDTFIAYDPLFQQDMEFRIVGRYQIVPVQGYYDIVLTMEVIE